MTITPDMHTRDCREPRQLGSWWDRADSGSGGRCVCCGARLEGPCRRLEGLGWITASCGCGPLDMDPPVDGEVLHMPSFDELLRAQRDADRRAWLQWREDTADVRAEQLEEARLSASLDSRTSSGRSRGTK